MSNKLFSLWMVIALCVTSLFASCSDDDNNNSKPTPEPKPATYTVMLYGVGGGNLDDALEYNLEQLDGLGKQSRVNFTGLIKFSQPFQDDPDKAGTRLLTMTDNGLTSQQVYGSDYALCDPDNLKKFMKETAEKMPADKYIIIFWDHGDVFGPDDTPSGSTGKDDGDDGDDSDDEDDNDPHMRAVMWDDNIGERALSTYDMEKAIKESGIKPELIYLDVCNMGMIETYAQLKDCAHYVMGAINLTPGLGGNYTRLISDLQNNDNLTDAIKSYVPYCVKNWRNASQGQVDLSCYDMTYMDELLSNTKKAIDEYKKVFVSRTEEQDDLNSFENMQRVLETYDKTTTYYDEENNPTGNLAYFGSELSTDLVNTLNRIAAGSLSGKLSSYATQIDNTIEKMTVATACYGMPEWMERVSMGINWTTPLTSAISYWDNLLQSNFNKVTGWFDYTKDFNIPEYFKTSLYSGNVYYIYGSEDEVNQLPTYPWDVRVGIPGSAGNENIADLVDEINQAIQDKMGTPTLPLCEAGALVEEVKTILDTYEEELNNLSINEVHIDVELQLGSGFDPDDPTVDQHDHSYSKKVSIDEIGM